jgi:predicted DNA-binding transcriptional regulator AlpA
MATDPLGPDPATGSGTVKPAACHAVKPATGHDAQASAAILASDPPRLALRPREAARALGIGARLLWSLTNRGEVPHVRLGRAIVYPVEALRDWLATRSATESRR